MFEAILEVPLSNILSCAPPNPLPHPYPEQQRPQIQKKMTYELFSPASESITLLIRSFLSQILQDVENFTRFKLERSNPLRARGR